MWTENGLVLSNIYCPVIFSDSSKCYNACHCPSQCFLGPFGWFQPVFRPKWPGASVRMCHTQILLKKEHFLVVIPDQIYGSLEQSSSIFWSNCDHHLIDCPWHWNQLALIWDEWWGSGGGILFVNNKLLTASAKAGSLAKNKTVNQDQDVLWERFDKCLNDYKYRCLGDRDVHSRFS